MTGPDALAVGFAAAAWTADKVTAHVVAHLDRKQAAKATAEVKADRADAAAAKRAAARQAAS